MGGVENGVTTVPVYHYFPLDGFLLISEVEVEYVRRVIRAGKRHGTINKVTFQILKGE